MLQIMLLFFNHLIVNKTFFSINPFFLFLHGFLVFKLNSKMKNEISLNKELEQLNKRIIELLNSIAFYTYEVSNYELVKECEEELEKIQKRIKEIKSLLNDD